MLIPAAAAAAGKLVPAAVLGTTAVRFALTGVYELTASGGWQDAAGIVGLLLCGLGLYAALAMALEDALGKTVLPLGRRGLGRESMGDPGGPGRPGGARGRRSESALTALEAARGAGSLLRDGPD
jgi:uncharacterized protein